jgi:uncharacterized protein with GYD domain
MAYYLAQVAYTPDAWAAQIKNPQDVRERVQAMYDRLGGRLVGVWYALGEYDLVAICEFPGNVHALGSGLQISAGGAVKALKTTPLMTIEEGIEAMRKAGVADYQPPSS